MHDRPPGGGPGYGYMMRTLAERSTIVLPEPDGDFLDTVRVGRPDLLAANPFTIAGMIESLRDGESPPASLDRVVVTGGRLTSSMLKTVRARLCPRVLCSYASTETGLIAWPTPPRCPTSTERPVTRCKGWNSR